MSLIDREFYLNEYHGEALSEDEFPQLRERAEMVICEMSMYRLTDTTFLCLSESAQMAVKNAVCAQIEYLVAGGGTAFLNEPDGLQSAGLGKFNYTRSSAQSGADDTYSSLARRYLYPTGLLYRGGACR